MHIYLCRDFDLDLDRDLDLDLDRDLDRDLDLDLDLDGDFDLWIDMVRRPIVLSTSHSILFANIVKSRNDFSFSSSVSGISKSIDRFDEAYF
jgi:hypothetical protein